MRVFRAGLIAASLMVGVAATSVSALPSAAADGYFQQALVLIRQHHRNSTKADWPRIEARARSMLAGASQPADTYPAIRMVLDALNERHSHLIEAPSGETGPAKAGVQGSAPRPKVPSMPTWALVNKRFGQLRLPELDTLYAEGSTRGASYVASARAALTYLDKARPCGWIIDLRENGGGDMWPMLRGLDPLLGIAPFGLFVLPDGSKLTWVRAYGNIFPSPKGLPASSPAFSLTRSSAPIAVLIGPQTASSGEMTAIALIGQPRVRVFGARSAGFTTANKAHLLSDGAMLVLTETSVQDRTGKDYVGPITPDEQLDPAKAEEAAQRWLGRQCA